VTSKHHKDEKELQQYTYEDKKRSNNPQVGLVTAETDISEEKKSYSFDPHLDPKLNWTGKVEGMNFEVDTVSLHVHQRVDPLTIIQTVKKKELQEQRTLFYYFESAENNLPIREAIEFYKHSLGWSNRVIAGDSLLVMNSLLQKEGMGGKVQMIYMDPPYGIKYGSNFQPFVNKRDVTDQKDEDLTQEPETIKSFRDTWELGIHSYLTYLRNRILLAQELLTEGGSIFFQISDENVHLVRNLMDEIFGSSNFVAQIIYTKTSGFASNFISTVNDYIIWYAKDKSKLKSRSLYLDKKDVEGINLYKYIELKDGTRRKLTKEEIQSGKIPEGKLFRISDITSQGGGNSKQECFVFNGQKFYPSRGRNWSTNIDGLSKLVKANRVILESGFPQYVRYLDDYPVTKLTNLWSDTATGGFTDPKIYVVQTNTKAISRCILMTTDPGDIVLDPTCGSGTTAYCAEKWGRRWITCDTSRVAITITKQRLMTGLFDYYELAFPNEGISAGFNYKTVSHVTLGSIANNEPPGQEILYDQPLIDKSKKRVTGPFTVEAVPSPRVLTFEELEKNSQADMSIARSGETAIQNEWIDELLATGIKGKEGQKIEFLQIDSLPGTRFIHAHGQTKDGQKGVISFGPKHSPLEQKQVELALQEAHSLVPKPSMVVFASFQFDPEAAKDIDVVKWPGMIVLKVQMNTDLLTSDLKKKRSSNESFWLIGQPDIRLIKKGDKYIVEVKGFDYYNTRTGQIESGDVDKIAIWELDTDYDGRSLYPRQVFFPMSGQNDGWGKLAKNLKSHIDEDLIEQYRGTISLPFKMGSTKQIAVKIIDDRGIESLRIMDDRDVSSK